MTDTCEECGKHAVDCECTRYEISKEERDAICGVNEALLGCADGYKDPKSKSRYDSSIKDLMKKVIEIKL